MNSYGAITQAFPNPDWVLEDKPRAITAFFKNLTKETSENTKKSRNYLDLYENLLYNNYQI